jgi:ubiquinone/menaquinone biosynthesis C-methylase UbiE
MTDAGLIGASSAWRNVDGGTARAVQYLERLTVELTETKAKVLALLRLAPGQAVLEAGCGLGHDTEAMARQVAPKGHAVGLDLSQELIALAAARAAPLGLPLRFEVGSVMKLPFEDACFDAVRIERTLQHLPDPAEAVAELARVLRPGGRLAAFEPDWHTAVVAGGPVEVMQAYVRQKADKAIANGRMGRELPWLVRQAGCAVTEVASEVLVIRDLASADFIFSLRMNVANAVAVGFVSAEAVDEWWAALEERDRAGAFLAFGNGVMVGATRE